MSCFSTVSAVTANSELDLTKHVNYTSGMILGVDDFTQEFAYLAGRNRWLARDVLGYGTISGLSVQIENDAGKGFRVMVQPGVAINPRGQLICVPATQCAYFNQWLAAADAKELNKWIRHEAGSPPVSPPPTGSELTLYVTLCYRDCLTDNVPIPGEPCRNEAELTAASRVKDDFSLELRFEPPKQSEENAVRKFVEQLKQIELTESGSSTPLEDFIKAIRDEWHAPLSPPITSPPEVLQIHTDDFCDYMRAAFRLWVTELRNESSDRETGCAVEMTGANKIEDCILLAELRVPLESLSPGWKVSDTEEIEVTEENRPFLLHLRMLQEWMLCGLSRTEGTNLPITSPHFSTEHGALTGLDDDDHKKYLLIDGTREMKEKLNVGSNRIIKVADGEDEDDAVTFHQAIKRDDDAGGDLTDRYPNPTIGKLQGKLIEANPTEGQILKFKGGKWIAADPEPTAGGVTDHGELTGLKDDEHHEKYLLIDGTREMTGNLKLGSQRIIDLADGEENLDAVTFQQAIKRKDDAGGDLSEKYPSPQVIGLRGKPIADEEPDIGDVLVCEEELSGKKFWTPKPQLVPEPVPKTQPFMILPLATITRTVKESKLFFDIWFNIDAPENWVEINENFITSAKKMMTIFGEENTSKYLKPIDFVIEKTGIRNLFKARLENEMDLMRFKFNLSVIKVTVEKPTGEKTTMFLDEYARQNDIKFMGDENKKGATIFVRGIAPPTRPPID